MSRDAWLTQLRVAADDASAVVRLLADGPPDDGPQMAGQAVLRRPQRDHFCAVVDAGRA